MLARDRGTLARASGIAKAAVTCAEAGQEREAVQIVLDLEQLTGEANHLLGMATLITGMQRERATSAGDQY